MLDFSQLLCPESLITRTQTFFSFLVSKTHWWHKYYTVAPLQCPDAVTVHLMKQSYKYHVFFLPSFIEESPVKALFIWQYQLCCELKYSLNFSHCLCSPAYCKQTWAVSFDSALHFHWRQWLSFGLIQWALEQSPKGWTPLSSNRDLAKNLNAV